MTRLLSQRLEVNARSGDAWLPCDGGLQLREVQVGNSNRPDLYNKVTFVQNQFSGRAC